MMEDAAGLSPTTQAKSRRIRRPWVWPSAIAAAIFVLFLLGGVVGIYDITLDVWKLILDNIVALKWVILAFVVLIVFRKPIGILIENIEELELWGGMKARMRAAGDATVADALKEDLVKNTTDSVDVGESTPPAERSKEDVGVDLEDATVNTVEPIDNDPSDRFPGTVATGNDDDFRRPKANRAGHLKRLLWESLGEGQPQVRVLRAFDHVTKAIGLGYGHSDALNAGRDVDSVDIVASREQWPRRLLTTYIDLRSQRNSVAHGALQLSDRGADDYISRVTLWLDDYRGFLTGKWTGPLAP